MFVFWLLAIVAPLWAPWFFADKHPWVWWIILAEGILIFGFAFYGTFLSGLGGPMSLQWWGVD